VLVRLFSKPFFIAVLLWFFLGAMVYFTVNLLVMPYFAGKFIGKVKVPALVGLQPDKAKDILKANGLLYIMDSTGDFSNDIVAGHILSQYPLLGTEVKRGRRIWVRISKGLKSVELPALRGLSLRQAEITLQQLGLKLGRVREVSNTNFPAGAVIGTKPKANALLEKGRSVDIEVSEGKDIMPSTMPSLAGLTLSQAKEQLKNLGLPMGNITSKKEAHSLPNTVLVQSPAAGSPLMGKSVDLVISK
jgi:eukaryotic-like serine/threonine-protein kinase